MPFKLNYTDVVQTVVRLVLLIYNKLIEVCQVSNRSMFKTLSSIVHNVDKEIVDKVLNEICADLNYVARQKAQMRLTQVYECLSLTRLPNVMTPRSAAVAAASSTTLASSRVIGAGADGRK